MHSSPLAIMDCDAFREIVARGETALPDLFAELAAGHHTVVLALRSIVGRAPFDVFPGTTKAVRGLWLEWGREQGYWTPEGPEFWSTEPPTEAEIAKGTEIAERLGMAGGAYTFAQVIGGRE